MRAERGQNGKLPPPWQGGEAVAEGSRRGRGSVLNGSGRYEREWRTAFDDGWNRGEDAPPSPKTAVTVETPRHILSRNNSPDIPFDRSINPYRGCEHGCAYCFARPTHAYLGLSPGLDFESRLFAKDDAAALLAGELSKPGYVPAPIAIGTNTDAYQPIERERKIMRGILEVLDAFNHPVTILTKSALIVRDIDILSRMAGKNLVRAALSVTTLDHKLARALEPRASTPSRRLTALKMLSDAGVPAGVMFAPAIPGLNDHEMEAVLEAASRSGALSAGYILLRLPREVAPLFSAWLDAHRPGEKEKVLKRLAAMRGGRLNDPRFGARFKGEGAAYDLMRDRFRLKCRALGLNRADTPLECAHFRVPGPLKKADERQLSLF